LNFPFIVGVFGFDVLVMGIGDEDEADGSEDDVTEDNFTDVVIGHQVNECEQGCGEDIESTAEVDITWQQGLEGVVCHPFVHERVVEIVSHLLWVGWRLSWGHRDGEYFVTFRTHSYGGFDVFEEAEDVATEVALAVTGFDFGIGLLDR
jgi:hypothetical protein